MGHLATVGHPGKSTSPSASIDVLFTFAHDTWEDATLRGMERPHDRLLERLLVDSRVGELIVADAFRTWFRFVKELPHERSRPRRSSEGPLVRHVRPRRFRRQDPVDIEAIRQSYNRYGDALKREASRAGVQDLRVITANPLVAGFTPLEWAETVTFYARDDWSSYPAHRHLWPAYEAAYRRIREDAIRVAAVSSEVLDRIAPTGASMIVPNGISEEEWCDPPPAPGWFAKLPGPKVVYTGFLDERLDTALLTALAQQLNGSLVLLGALAWPEGLAGLIGRPNVYQRHLHDRRELVAAVSAADVCVVPHRVSRFTAAMSPLKLYEYLAAGRPVVATDAPSHEGVDPIVTLADTQDGFVQAVRRALDGGPMDEARRLRFIAENSWKVRHDGLLELALGS